MSARRSSRASSCHPSARRHRLLLAATATAICVAPGAARAGERYWVDTTNFWTANFWSLTQGGAAGQPIPGNGDNAYVFFNDTLNRTITYNNPSPIDTLNSLQLDNTGGGTSTLSQSQGSLGMSFMYDGYNGSGAYVLGGGTNTVGSLYLGVGLAGRGAYTLNGTGVLNTTFEYLGYQGQGTFTQSAGTHVASNTMILGYVYNGTNAASNATYTMSGGTLSVGNTNFGTLAVGYFGNGTFNHSGGAVTAYDLYLGRFNNGGGTNAASTGSYSMTGTANLTIRNGIYVGDGGTGTFVQNAGTVTFTGTSTSGLILGRSTGAVGTYTLNGGSISIPTTGFTPITLGQAGTGTFNQAGGTVTTSFLYAGTNSNGTNATSSGTYNLTGGTLTTGQDYFGYVGNGTFNQTNGAHVTGALNLGSFSPGGGAPNPTGTINLSGGTLTADNVYAASGGNASINQTGGTFTVNNWLRLGYGFGYTSNAAGYATYTLADGVLNPVGISVGYGGTNTSTLTQTGGTNNATSFMTVGDQAGNKGVYNLQGGTLTVLTTNVSWLGNGTVNQSGGTNTTNSLFLGHQPGGVGAYNLSAGTLTVGGLASGDTSAYVGYYGTGSFNQSGGTHTIVNGNFSGLYVGYGNGSTGAYTLSGGTLNVAQQYAETYVGFQGTGTCTQYGGVHNAYYMTTGYNKPGVGTYSMYNGTLTAQFEYEGFYGDGTFNQYFGNHTTNGLFLGYGLNDPANGGAATGTFNLSGGSFTSTGYEQIGMDGVGTFNQTSATHVIGQAGSNNAYLRIGVGVTGIGNYTLSGGTLTVNGSEQVGYGGTGIFTQTGGTHTVTGGLSVANLSGSTGAYHLNGGGLTAAVANNGTFDFGSAVYNGAFGNNGTLNVTAAGGTFNGTLTASAAALTNVYAPLSISGGATNAGSIVVANATPLNINGPGLLNDGGNITLNGGSLGGNGPILNNGTIAGFGQIAGVGALTNNGVITQGAGNLTFAKSAGTANNNDIALAGARQLALFTGLTNNATLELNGATVNGTAPLVNTAAGLIVGPGAITAPLTNAGTIALPAGTLNLQQPLTSSGAIQLNAFTAHLVGGALTNTGTIQGIGVVSNALTNNGTIEAIGGTLSLTGPLANNSTGILRAATGNKLLASAGLATNAGVINLAGGTFDNNGLPMNNTGQLSGFGTFATGGLTNNGAVFLTGGNSVVNGPVTNTVGNKISVRYNPALFTGPVTNAGTLEVIGTVATFAAGGPLPAPLPGAPAAASLPGGALDGPGTTTLTSGGSLVADHVRQTSLNIADGVVTLRPGATTLAPNGTSVVNQLTLGPTSRLDLANNALVVDYDTASPLADIRSYVLAAYHNGDWQGPGLTSSLLPTTHNGVIGFGEASAILGPTGGTFAGQSVDPTAVFARLTLGGDANLDGRVNFSDLLTLARNYNKTNVPYTSGDFNYDGLVNFADLLTLARNYNGVLAAEALPADAPANFAADLTATINLAAVPEPSTLATIAACGLMLATRRRRR